MLRVLQDVEKFTIAATDGDELSPPRNALPDGDSSIVY